MIKVRISVESKDRDALRSLYKRFNLTAREYGSGCCFFTMTYDASFGVSKQWYAANEKKLQRFCTANKIKLAAQDEVD